MKKNPQIAKNNFYRKLRLDKETRETLKLYNKLKKAILKRLDFKGK